MAVKTKYFNVEFGEGETVASADTPAYQWDKGIVLVLSGIELADGYVLEANCRFDSQDNGITSYTSVSDGKINIHVPDLVLTKGVQVFATVQLTADDSTVTIYEARLPVLHRAKPHGYEITEDDKTMLDELADAINQAVAIVGKFQNVEATIATQEDIDRPTVEQVSTEDTTTFNFTFPELTPISAEEIEAQIDW